MNNSRTPAAKALRKARDLYDDSRDIARNGADRASGFIHQRPVLSTLLGLGAGLLIGHLLRPRD
jgi:ElaB/YqjD/DUF883 family membrane-anchored ribosome-binding protein